MDIFEKEQRIYDNAIKRAAKSKDSMPVEDYLELTIQYKKLLKQLRRATKFADRTSIGLHENNLVLEDKVHYDTLTGIYNRRYMEENLAKLMKSSARSGDMLSLLIVDIDFFKPYNDNYGHGQGDECIKTVANALSDVMLRAEDFVARYGGEEFIVVLPKTDEKGANRIGEKLLESVRNSGLKHEKSSVADHVTISIGATTASPSQGCQFESYIKTADEALYISKQNGRNRYTYKEFTKNI